MQRIIVMKSEKVSLVIPEKQDIDLWYKGMNNLETNIFLWNKKDNYYKEDIEELYDKIVKEENSMYFSIFNEKSKSVIWICSIKNIKKLSRQWEIYLFIFDKNNQNKWFWTETLNLLIQYWFEILWLNKITLSYLDWNENAWRLYKKVWFREVWKFREDVFIRWELKDQIFMEIFRKNFKG